ncbi:CAP domain-containing protein [Chytridium lagenaria]|nr:CAP domain-containing protein [Chytridium lagenaria]
MRIYSSNGDRLLNWDTSLQAQAYDIARSLANRNCELDHGGRQGENLWALRGAISDGWCARATGDWISEGFYGREYNHASQLSWSTVRNLGCASFYSSGFDCQVVVCHYDPWGNFIGRGDSPFFDSGGNPI